MNDVKKAFTTTGTGKPVKTSTTAIIPKVLELLTDRTTILSIDPHYERIIETDKCCSGIVNPHPLYLLCGVSCILFLRLHPTPDDFQAYYINDFQIVRTGRDANHRFLKVRATVNHYFIKKKSSGEIIDITKSQFGNIVIPYNLGRRCNLKGVHQLIDTDNANN